MLRRSLPLFLLIGGSSLGVWLRVATLQESLWLDELHTSWVVAERLADVAPRAAQGHQAPLFFWMTWGVTAAWGMQECTLRTVSWLSGLCLIVVAGWFTFRLSKSLWLAALTITLVALDRHCIFYAQEARPYALLQLLSLAQVICFWRLLNHPSARLLLLWVGLSWAVFYTHYTGAWVFFAEAVFWPLWQIRTRHEAHRGGWAGAMAAAVVALGCTPAIGHLQQIADRRSNWAAFVPRPDLADIASTFQLTTYLLVPVLALACAAMWQRDLGDRDESQFLMRIGRLEAWLICWFFVPVLSAWILSRLDLARLFFRRYMIVTVIVPLLTPAVLGMRPSVRPRTALYVAVCLLMMVGVIPWLESRRWMPVHSQEDWRTAVAMVGQLSSRVDEPVFLRAHLIEDDILRSDVAHEWTDYCLFPLRGIYRVHPSSRPLIPLPSTDSWRLTTRQRQLIERCGAATFLIRARPTEAAEIRAKMVQEIRAAGREVRVIRATQTGNLDLFRVVFTGRQH